MSLSITDIYAKINAARMAKDAADSQDVEAYFNGKTLTAEEILNDDEMAVYRHQMAIENAAYAESETA